MAAADRLNLVFAVVEARDRSLANFDYSLEKLIKDHHSGSGTAVTSWRGRFEMRRLDGRVWMRHIVVDLHDGKTKSDSACNWDGATARAVAFPPYEGVQFAQGTVTQSESRTITLLQYNELLGLSVALSTRELPTLLSFFRQLFQRGKKIDVSSDRLDGAEMIVVKTGFAGRDFAYWLDPARGFMIVRHHYRNGAGAQSTFTVLSAEAASGVWVPTHAVRHKQWENDPDTQDEEYVVSSFKIGSVRQRDVDVDFPLGSHVMDDIHKIAYIVQPDGSDRLLALADVRAHVLYAPPKRNVVAAVDANTPAMYKKQPLVLATHQPPRVPVPGRRIIYIVVNLVVVVAVVLMLVVKRRGRQGIVRRPDGRV